MCSCWGGKLVTMPTKWEWRWHRPCNAHYISTTRVANLCTKYNNLLIRGMLCYERVRNKCFYVKPAIYYIHNCSNLLFIHRTAAKIIIQLILQKIIMLWSPFFLIHVKSQARLVLYVYIKYYNETIVILTLLLVVGQSDLASKRQLNSKLKIEQNYAW